MKILAHLQTQRTIKLILIVLLMADLTFSFLQYYQTPLFGDMEGGILPNKYVQQVLDDPLGFNALRSGEKHMNPNRYFAHIFFMEYFRNVPFWLQTSVNPVQSVYLSCALAKIMVQIFFIFLLSHFISGSRKILSFEFLLSAAIISPLFQAYGFWSRMGINDKSIAYTFFYAIPLVLLMVFMLPVFRSIRDKSKFSRLTFAFLVPFTIVLPLSGPLIPGVTLIVALLIIAGYFFRQGFSTAFNVKHLFVYISPLAFILMSIITLWSLYSLWLGLFYDINYVSDTIPVADRYTRLPEGILSYLFHSAGVPLMLSVIVLNVFLIRKHGDAETANRWLSVLKWIGIFAILYVILLPMGGYRPYRLRIIRYDTIMPVTMALIYFFGATTFFLIKHMTGTRRKKYLLTIAVCLSVFTVADIKGLQENRWEIKALEKIAASPETPVPLPKDAWILSWETTTDYKRSEQRAMLLHYWGITDKIKLFYNEL